MGVLLVSAHFANAEDKAPPAPAVSFSGWSDNILTISDDDTKDDTVNSKKDESKPFIRFSAAASLKADWKVADKVEAKINLWFYPDVVSSSNANFQAREMYFTYAVADGVTWQMGQFIDHIGWASA